MLRRLISVIGMLALTLAYLPAAMGGLSPASAPDCCNGVMCPMHRMAGAHTECDGVAGRSGASLQSCPDNAQRYTVALSFVRVAPSVLLTECVVSPATVFVSRVPLSADLGVTPPPPRSRLIRPAP